MDFQELDKIEKYLSKQLTEEEEKSFEKDISTFQNMDEEVKAVAYIIYSIHKIGIKNDNKRLDGLRSSLKQDYKKYWTSIAALFIITLSIAAITSVPIYKYVAKPIIEKIMSPKISVPKQNTVQQPVTPTIIPDSVIADSVIADSVIADSVIADMNITTECPQMVPTARDTSNTEVKQELTVQHKDTIAVPVITKCILPNRILSYSHLTNYSFSPVSVQRNGRLVICTFTMTNTEESADIQMHSARAVDKNGKNYPAKVCLLNGSTKRIKEHWKKNIPYTVSISINEVQEDVDAFEQISFSFQSDGDYLKQKSQSIIVKVGEIK
ncbi:hypothetical protein [Phocaeicola sartorii]|uniref:hypothetical protein n=1 Tax=Phocaeicola sartorii TaxID=671267 RepID=UPI000468C98F|nr:hypothetical protein [Phocaeicola sartorii]MCR1846593.1 hypothetical protein [Phocaeicola sartorii]